MLGIALDDHIWGIRIVDQITDQKIPTCCEQEAGVSNEISVLDDA